MSLPAYISNLIRDASDAQDAIAELLCQYQLAYRDMDDAVCLAPLYRGWSMETLLNKLSKLIQYEETMTVQGNLIVHGDYIESGATKTIHIEHLDHMTPSEGIVTIEEDLCTYSIGGNNKSRQQIEEDLRRCSQQSANQFASLLMNYRDKGWIDFHNESMNSIFSYLQTRYHLPYNIDCFRRYFN